MLSILIPVYNFDILPLVQQLHLQLSDVSIAYEIICQDDASENSISKANSEIENLDYTIYKISKSNKGRIATRQLLAENAKYDWLLFIDADTLPKNISYLKDYIKYLEQDYQVIYGGFAYKDEGSNSASNLRWKYGRTKEQVSAYKRNKRPYKIAISANFLIQKSVFKHLNSIIDQKGYGYDNYFASLLKQHQIKVLHVDNEVYHIGLESNEHYLNKVEASVKNLLDLERANKLSENDNSLLHAYKSVKRLKLNRLISLLFKWFESSLKLNLLGSKPNILGLQFYKLGYICYIDLKT